MASSHELILILDFGSQYTQLIARRVREAQVFCQIVPFSTPVAEILKLEPKGLFCLEVQIQSMTKSHPELKHLFGN